MPRSLSQAGINEIPFWVKVEHFDNQPFYIAQATLRQGRFGAEEVVFKLRLRDGVYDEDGALHRIVWCSLSAGTEGQRRDIVRYFLTQNDPLGPLMITRVPTDSGNDFFRMDDVEAATVRTLEVAPRTVPARHEVDQAEGKTLEDLPF